VALQSLFPPHCALFPYLFLRGKGGRILPENETLLDVFDHAQLSIKNARCVLTRVFIAHLRKLK
jgi:hypothetical protein